MMYICSNLQAAAQFTSNLLKMCSMQHYLVYSYNTRVILIISFEQVYQRLIQNPVKNCVLQKHLTAENH